MPRVIKHPDQRRAEILDLAMSAFLRSGYDNVSLNEIISNAEVSKGAFYHWFASKEALITALAERNAQQGYALVEEAVNRCTGDALERLNTLLEASFDMKVQMGVPEVLVAMTSLLRPENAYLYERIVTISQELFRPLLTQVISDGVDKGVFNTFDPEGVGDMLQTLAASTNTMLLKVLEAAEASTRNKAIETLARRYRLHGCAIDRILGLPDGSTRALTRDQVRVMCTGQSPAARARSVTPTSTGHQH
jgi:TetR/AcrR family transcriptional regulator, cholesterol catabolism regulator